MITSSPIPRSADRGCASPQMAKPPVFNTTLQQDWRCKKCGKLLGVYNGTRLHIRDTRGHQYLVGFPVTGICRGCGTLNEFQHTQAGNPTSLCRP